MSVIAHVSDSHFGRTRPEVVAALLGELDGRTAPLPTLVALSGDLTQRARRAQFRECRAFLNRLTVPYLVVPGNHDVPLFNLWKRFLSPLGNYRDEVTDDLAPTFIDDTIAVAGVATAHGFTVQGGRVTRDQVAAATTALSAATDQWKVIVAHHPFAGPERAKRDFARGADAALTAFRAAGVDLILTGHLHVSFSGEDAAMRDEQHRIVSVHAGTCTSTRTRREPNNYNRITFAGDDVTVLVRMWNGSAFIDGKSKTYRRGGAEIRKLT